MSNIKTDQLRESLVSDQEMLFRLGLLTLCKNKVGFARFFFRDAAKGGNKRAQKYLSLLEEKKVSVANWRQEVMNLEAKYLIFGEE